MLKREKAIEREFSGERRVMRPHERHEFFVIEAASVDAGRRFVDQRHHHVSDTLLQRFDPVRARRDDIEIEGRCLAGEAGKQMRRERGGLEIGHKKPDSTRRRRGIERVRFQHFSYACQYPAQHGAHLFSTGAEDVAARPIDQQRVRKQRAQSPQGTARGRLAHAEPVGGPCDALLIQQRLKRYQQVEVDTA